MKHGWSWQGWVTGTMVVMCSGCPIPPSLELDTSDAGTNAPPVMIATNPDFALPGPFSLDRQDPREISLTVIDNNPDDQTYVRFYRDYNRPEPQPYRVECQSSTAATPQRERSITCPMKFMCNDLAANDTSQHVLTAMFSDRIFLTIVDDGIHPPYQVVADYDHAGISYQSWIFTCNPP